MMSFDTEFAVLGVSELTEKIRGRLETAFPFVWVRGEVTNISRPPSGHLYFSLKDDQAQLQCVWFSRKNRDDLDTFDPLTGEVYDTPRPAMRKRLCNGMEILCCGPISVYGSRGQYQLLVDFARLAGNGRLAQEFEDRKIRLAALGFFNDERKRPLPINPSRVALVTSPHGAAIHDFMRIGGERGLSATIRLFPVPVQGIEAAGKIAAAIESAGAQKWADLIVVIRGGGSLEDLWAFNEDVVAKAIFNAPVPVVAGIGHEIDFSLADLTADLRAATPSHAAQIIWPQRSELIRHVDELDMDLRKGMEKSIFSLENILRHRQEALDLLSPRRRLRNLEQRRLELARNLRKSALTFLDRKSGPWNILAERVRNVSILKEKIKTKRERLDWLASGLGRAFRKILENSAFANIRLGDKLKTRGVAFVETREKELKQLEASLLMRNPLEPLKRGYALLYGKKGLARSVKNCSRGESLKARLYDGILEVEVKSAEILAGDANEN